MRVLWLTMGVFSGVLILMLSGVSFAMALGNQRTASVLAYNLTTGTQVEQVRVIDTDSRVSLNITPPEQGAARPVWSPDGDWLVFRASFNPRADTRFYATRLDRRDFQWLNMPVDLSNFPALYFEPRWTPDGQQIIFASHDSLGALRYYRSEIATGKLTALKDDDADVLYYESSPSELLSPDGTKQFLIEYIQSTGLLHLSIIEEQNTRLLYQFPDQGNTFSLLPRWAPDSYHIAACLWVNGREQIFLLDIDGSTPRRITHAGGTSPVWRPRE